MKTLHLLQVLWIVSFSTASAQIGAPPTPGVGAKAVGFSEKSTAGQPILFPDAYKGKLVMLDFWATWCGPCRAELPNLVKVYEEFHARGFEVVGISLDSDSTLPKLAAFTGENHMAWPQIADGQAWKAKLGQMYHVQAIPAAWLVDGTTGQVVAVKNELRGDALRATVERCLRNLGNPVPAPAATSPVATQGSKAAATPAPLPPDPALAVAEALAKAGRLANADAFAALIAAPKREKIDILPMATQPLKGREIATRARLAHVRIGWFFHCTRCNNWHLNAAGGYAIARDTVATAYHVLEPPVNMKAGDGYPVIIRGDTEVIPITGVLGADKEMDAVIVRVGATDLSPVPLASNVQIGDPAYCFSDPHNTRGYFSNGIVNRIYSIKSSASSDPRYDRINVSTDWSPGSSGSAVLDECGNVIGHVARIESISKNVPTSSLAAGTSARTTEPNATYMNLHEAVAAKAVLSLIGPPKTR